jgi:hypothetical protein
MNSSELYTGAFYAERCAGSLSSAEAALRFILARKRVSSVADIGCGVGTWLKVARDLGISTGLGYDGPWVSTESLLIPREMFVVHNLSAPITGGRRCELVISTEVGEHLEACSAEALVSSLVGFGGAILFSAAIPDQGGTGHVNERWPEYWSRLFGAHGYLPCDVLRPFLWDRDDVDYWYAQNLILYVRHGAADWFHAFSSVPSFPCVPHPQPLVHPRAFLRQIKARRDLLEHRSGLGVRWCLIELIAAVRGKLRHLQ